MLARLQPAESASTSPPAAARTRMPATVTTGTIRDLRRYTRRHAAPRDLVTALLLVALAATSAGASPSRSSKLTGPEQKWATPVIQVWNLMNAGLQGRRADDGQPRARARDGREQDARS